MIRCVSFNCHSLRNNIDIVNYLVESHDVILLQELMISECDVGILECLNDDYACNIGVRDKVENGIIKGRPSRGVAILYKKSFLAHVEHVNLNDRINGIIIKQGENKTLILNIYMPYDAQNLDSLDDYRHCLSLLEGIIEESDISNLIIAGDMNADVKKGRFWKELKYFIDKLNLYHVTSELPDDSFTYLCPAKSTTSLLDHVICNNFIKNKISDVSVIYDLCFYDHMPIQFIYHLNLEVQSCSGKNPNRLKDNYINWNKKSQKDINDFKYKTEKSVQNTELSNFRFLSCNDFNCKDESHLKEIDSFFNLIINILLLCSTNLFNSNSFKFKQIPGWNEYLKTFYHDARDKFLTWVKNGRPLDCLLHDDMVRSRKNFKTKLKLCKKNKNKIKNDKMAENLAKNNSKSFWKGVKERFFKRPEYSLKIDGSVDPFVIVNKFSCFFKSIFNADQEMCLEGEFRDVEYTYTFTVDDVKAAIMKLNPYVDIDSIYSQHLKFASKSLIELITLFVNGCLKHSYLPNTVTRGLISPILKDKLKDHSSLENYRPIIKSSIFLKLFEYLILDRISCYLNTNDRQHGFKANHSTTTACFFLKEVIYYYLRNFSPVYAVFLDFSKAFDRVKHSVLIGKLVKIGVPGYYIRFIAHWYANQFVSVQYGEASSSQWKITNGVRQGGILSPALFNIYINDMISEIVSSGIGCRLGLYVANVIAYADDLVLLAPTLSGLQKLINLCYNHSVSLSLLFSSSKCFCMKFMNGLIPLIDCNNVTLNQKIIKFVSEIRYLGFMLSFNMCNKSDIVFRRNKFYNSFNTILRKFYDTSLDVFLNIFKSYCFQFYGCELWYGKFRSATALRQFAVGYHRSIKKVFNVPDRESNHLVCEIAGLLTFEHQVNWTKIRFIHRLFSDPPYFIKKNYHFMFLNSQLLNEVYSILDISYDVKDILTNDIDALKSRIYFIHNSYNDYLI